MDASPFDSLHPVMRNEEDEIRKGIFSYALRKLHALTLAERLAWCEAIQESTAVKGAKKTVPDRSAVKDEKDADTAAPLRQPSSTQAGGPSVATDEASQEVAAVGDKRPRSDEPAQDFKLEHSAEDAVKVEAVRESRSTGAPQTSEDATEYIGAYLRTLLDKVIGGGLNDLTSPALRVLCVMVGIHTKTRAKDGLYSMLASFHFTNCAKLGKRVSRDTFVQQQTHQTAEMMKRLHPTGSAQAKAKKSAAEAVGTTAEKLPQASSSSSSLVSSAQRAGTAKSRRGEKDSLPAERSGTSARRRDKPETGKRPITAADGQAGATTFKAAPQSLQLDRTAAVGDGSARPYRYPSSEEYSSDQSDGSETDDEDQNNLSVSYRPRVFTSSGASSSLMHDGAGEVEGGLWSPLQLERKIASIVQLYDPVTVATVVKKLFQMGYRDTNAAEVVEGTLKRFHSKQLIFYDNGIAYMM